MISSQLPLNPIQTLQTHTGPINAITFSHLGGTYILTGSSDRQIHLSRTEPASSSPSSSSSHNTTAAVTTTTPIQKYSSHGYAVLSISVSSQNTHFASAGGDRAVFYWDIQTPDTTLRRFGTNTSAQQAHTARVTCVSFAGPDDSVLVSGSDDRTVRLWDLKSRDGRPLQVWDEAKDSVSCLVVSNGDGSNSSSSSSEIITGSVDGRVRAYDLRMGRVVTDVQPGPVTSLDLTRDGKTVLVGCLDGRIRLMDRLNGACLKVFPSSSSSTTTASSGGEDGGDGYRNKELRLQSCLGGVDEGLVLSGSEGDGKVRAWDVLSGRLAGCVDVGRDDKVVSVVRWREGSKVQNRRDVWAAGGQDGIVKIFGD